MRKAFFCPPIVALVIFAVIAPVRRDSAAETMAYVSDSPGSSAPYWVAKEVGLFKKNGLDIELLFINGSSRAVQTLVAGDLHFSGPVGTSAMNGRMAGGDVIIIHSLVNTLPYYIIGKPAIKSPEDLKGRSAATHIPGTSADFALRLALLRFGIPYRDIKAVMVGGAPARIAAVMTGQLDFAVITESGKLQGEKAGLRVVLDMSKQNIPFQFTCTVTSGKMIQANPDKVMSLVKAMIEAVHYFKTHKEEAIKIMQKYTRGVERGILEKTYNVYSDLFVEDGHPTIEGLKNTLEVQASWDAKAAKAKVKDFVDLRFVEELKKTGFVDRLYGRR
ncbi:MAG: ABC transporter substrate-binding protein [Deltaproteobacteria bacterium]|nr:ABC transporter substrate-binding protein [Deltaproteobacteria bacterium]